jgi:phosphoribosylformylglycinamidine synthase
METPVISGNVSFYNESDLGAILPTPLIGMVGIMDDASSALRMAPASGSGEVWLIRVPGSQVRHEGLGASEYLAALHGTVDGLPCIPDVAGEKALCRFLADAAHNGFVASAHDLSEGGLACALAEMACVSNIGIAVEVDGEPFAGLGRGDACAFGEFPGWVLVCTHGKMASETSHGASKQFGLAAHRLGSWSSELDGLTMSGRLSARWSTSSLRDAYCGAIERALAR